MQSEKVGGEVGTPNTTINGHHHHLYWGSLFRGTDLLILYIILMILCIVFHSHIVSLEEQYVKTTHTHCKKM